MKRLTHFYCTTLLLAGALFLSPSSYAQTPLETVNNMFDAMREHDDKKFLAQFADNALLQRITKTNEIKNSDINAFADFVKQSKKHLDEKLFNVTVKQSDNLATIWAPFAFYLDGKLSHCGVNSFVLIKTNQQWKILYLIDNEHSGDCQIFTRQ